MAAKSRARRTSPQKKEVKNPGDKGNSNNGMLDNALGQIEKAFGKGSIMKLSDSGPSTVSGIPSGALSLDLALGGYGFPRGRVVELFGPESSGKTTLALHVIASAQKEGGIAAFIDAEHALDPSWAKRLGVNLEDLLVSQPTYGEEGLQIAEMLIKSNAVDCIVVDSVAALVPKAELDGEIGDSHVGLQARMMSQALRKLTGAISKPRNNPRRPSAEVLQFLPGRRPPSGHAARRRYDDGDSHESQDRQEQGGPSLPSRRVRHAQHARHQPGRRRSRPGRR